MKRGLMISCLCGVLLLTGCEGSLLGTDSFVPADYTNDIGFSIFPSVNNTTTVVHTCMDFMDNIRNGRLKEAYSQLNIKDTTFVSQAAFESYIKDWVFDDLTYAERSSGGIVYVDISGVGFATTCQLTEVEDAWKISLQDFTVQDFRLLVPTGMEATLDASSLSSYKVDSTVEGVDTYVIPEITTTEHKIGLATAFGTPIELPVSGTLTELDVTNYLSVPEPLRAQMFNLAGQTLSALNKTVLTRDWEAFTKYFAADVQVANFSTSFETGYQAKKDTYDFKLLDVRDLQLDPLDVRYTGYDTIEVTLGTHWQWSGKDDYKVDSKTGVVTVKRTSEMKMKSVVELQYDGEHWYVISVDSESLARLTAGLEQWR